MYIRQNVFGVIRLGLLIVLLTALAACSAPGQAGEAVAMQDEAQSAVAPAEPEQKTTELGETDDAELEDQEDTAGGEIIADEEDDDARGQNVEGNTGDGDSEVRGKQIKGQDGVLIEGEDEDVEGEEIDGEMIEGEDVEGMDVESIEGEDGMMLVAEGAPSTPVFVQVYVEKAPMTGEEARITMIITTKEDVPAVTANFELPEGVRAVGGENVWEGPLSAGETAKVTSVIVFDRPGEYTVTGVALAPINEDMVYGDSADVFLTVGVDSSRFGFETSGNTQLDASTSP